MWVPLLNFRKVSDPTFKLLGGPVSRVSASQSPVSWGPGPTFTSCPLRQYSIFINENDLREIDLHETSKRTALIVQTLTCCGEFSITLKSSLMSKSMASSFSLTLPLIETKLWRSETILCSYLLLAISYFKYLFTQFVLLIIVQI